MLLPLPFKNCPKKIVGSFAARFFHSAQACMARTMRMRRLFNGEDNKLLDVAIDHGVFNEDRFLTGIEGGPAPAACL
jgi:hypothetical protein